MEDNNVEVHGLISHKIYEPYEPYNPFEEEAEDNGVEGLIPNEHDPYQKLKEQGIKEGWWPKTASDNPKLYLQHCVAEPTKFSSDWLDKIRESNPCPECKGIGMNVIYPNRKCPLCEGGGEWISKVGTQHTGQWFTEALDRVKVLCPECISRATKNGNEKIEQINYGQRYICTKCKRQFIFLNLYKKEIIKEEVIHLFYCSYGCFAIEKKTGVSRKTLRKWIIDWLDTLPRKE